MSHESPLGEASGRRGEIEAQIRDRAARDPQFRARLLADPAKALSAELGVDLEGALVRVIVADAGEVVLVVPAQAAPTLSDAEISGIVGGTAGDPAMPPLIARRAPLELDD